jgi:hypothetical protein
VDVQVVLQGPTIGNITHGGLGRGPQGTAPLPTVVGLAGRASLKNVGSGLIVYTIPSELPRQAGGGDDVARTGIEPGAF